MSEVNRLVYSIIQFLCDQLQTGNLSSDASESLEVAIQCLEQAYGFNHADVTTANLHVTKSLLEIFRQATSNGEFGASLPRQDLSPEKKAEAEQLKNKGNELMKAEKFTEAVDCYTKAIEIDGQNAIYYCNRAAAQSKLNNHEIAISDCDKAINIDKNYSKAYGRKGLAHASLNQHREARECYEKAVNLDPENESYQNNLKIAEEKLKETNLGSQSGMFGMDSSGFNLSNLLSNPALMNMASQMMTDPNMQNLSSLGNILTNQNNTSNASSPAGVQALLQAGQQLAAQMQATNPELVEQLRRQMNPGDGNPPNQNPDPSPK